jgi:DNA-binding NarL/FixJ family response regulator
MIRVLIADDHTLFRQGLAELLSNEESIRVVGTASDGAAVPDMVAALQPDVLILDISMPGIDGFEVTRRLRARGLPVRILMLSMHKDQGTTRRAFELGIDGYVLKEEAFSDLKYAIRSVGEGKRFFSPSVMMALSKSEASAEATPLTPREREVVAGIAAGRTTKEIAAGLGISVKTVDTHRQHIMEKLGCHRATEIVLYALKTGLVK